MATTLDDRDDVYVVVCDGCGDGLDTGRHRDLDALACASESHDWLIWTDRGDLCPACAERWRETYERVTPPAPGYAAVVLVMAALALLAILATVVVR